MFVPFGEWAPDRPALASGVVLAENVLPIEDGYESGPQFLVDTKFDEIPGTPIKLLTFRDSTGGSRGFVFTLTHIYTNGPDGTWDDITHAAGAYTTDALGDWSVIPWGDSFYAVNGADKIQKYVFGNAACTDIDGLSGGVLSGKYSTIIRDFHVLANVEEDSTAYPFRVWWSGRLRPELFDPSLVTMAGWKDHVDIGTIRGITGGDYGVLYGSDGIARIDFAGPPGVFQFTNIDLEVGCLHSRSIIQVGAVTFWLSSRGFRTYGGGAQGSAAIGDEKVDRWFLANAALDKLHLMSTLILANRPVVAWLYVSTNSVDGLPDAVLFYNYRKGRFSSGKFSSLSLFGSQITSPDFVDDAEGNDLIDVDGPDELIDEDDGAPFLAGATRDNFVMRINNYSNPGTIITKEVGKPERRNRIIRARLVSDGRIGQYFLRVQSRDFQNDEYTQSPRLRPERSGSVAVNKRGRYNRITVELEDGFSRLMGLDLEMGDGGMR